MILELAGIKPSNSQTYSSFDVVNAIKKGVGTSSASVLIGCIKDGNNLYLNTITMCFDNHYHPIDCGCKIPVGFPCGSRDNKIIFPEW